MTPTCADNLERGHCLSCLSLLLLRAHASFETEGKAAAPQGRVCSARGIREARAQGTRCMPGGRVCAVCRRAALSYDLSRECERWLSSL